MPFLYNVYRYILDILFFIVLSLFLERGFYMGIQFPPIAFLCQLYLYIYILFTNAQQQQQIYIYIYICCCCCALVKSIIKPQTLNHLFEVHAYMHVGTLGSRGYFFLSILMVRGEAASTRRSAPREKITSREPYQTVSPVYFIFCILKRDLWSQGNMWDVWRQKKKRKHSQR